MHQYKYSHTLSVYTLSAVLSLLAFSATGCIWTFEKDWRAAKKCGVPCDNLAGLWEGTWESDYNGHKGRLRAIITKCSDGHYHARYHATFAAVIPYAYNTTHAATEGDSVTWFCGEEDLGVLVGGRYFTNGEANGRTFVACYQADKDHGTFRMCRVHACCGPVAGFPGVSGHAPIPVLTEPVEY